MPQINIFDVKIKQILILSCQAHRDELKMYELIIKFGGGGGITK